MLKFLAYSYPHTQSTKPPLENLNPLSEARVPHLLEPTGIEYL